MAEKDTYSSILAGMDSTKKSSDGESLMKGRTYIPRLSPDTREALVKALREKRKKKADDKMAARKAASDDYFASEADKAMAREEDQKKADAIEDKLKKLSIEQETRFKKGGKIYNYGGKTKKYRK